MTTAETSLRQARHDPAVSALVSAAETGQTAWIDDLATSADPHLQRLHGEGISTAVVMPISPAGRNLAVLEFCSTQHQPASAPADAALHSIVQEIGAAAQRLGGTGAKPSEPRGWRGR